MVVSCTCAGVYAYLLHNTHPHLLSIGGVPTKSPYKKLQNMNRNSHVSTTRLAQLDGLTSPELFAALLAHHYICRHAGRYFLEVRGFKAGGNYFESDNGDRWLVWPKEMPIPISNSENSAFNFLRIIENPINRLNTAPLQGSVPRRRRYLMDYSPESWLMNY